MASIAALPKINTELHARLWALAQRLAAFRAFKTFLNFDLKKIAREPFCIWEFLWTKLSYFCNLFARVGVLWRALRKSLRFKLPQLPHIHTETCATEFSGLLTGTEHEVLGACFAENLLSRWNSRPSKVNFCVGKAAKALFQQDVSSQRSD